MGEWGSGGLRLDIENASGLLLYQATPFLPWAFLIFIRQHISNDP
jgi:hypothetical protein